MQQEVDLGRQRMDAEELETTALRELLSRRRDGAFVEAREMNAWLSARATSHPGKTTIDHRPDPGQGHAEDAILDFQPPIDGGPVARLPGKKINAHCEPQQAEQPCTDRGSA